MTYLLISIIGLTVLFLAGPRARAHGRLTYRPGELGDDLDAALAAREAAWPDIRDGMQKEIIWRDPAARDKRPWAVVNIHGFSATKEELRPLPDLIADGLDANLFLTRLAGHGRSAEAMTEPTADDWLDDMAEALEIGQLLGEKVLVIGMSTGATMAAWAAMRDDMRDQMDAIVFISPNFEIRGDSTRYMVMPWARQLLRLFMGKVDPVRPDNAGFKSPWTSGYPAEAWLPMAAAVRYVQGLRIDKASHPALFIHSPADRVIHVPHMKAVHALWGGTPKDIIEVTDAEDPMQHIIAGRIISPTPTGRLSRQVLDWVRSLPAN
ncbi:MAG: alpha/beta fold hydrolase [Minwuia sp.]|nr:alpha/beta fold hydrolase [Minwuia sp.]